MAAQVQEARPSEATQVRTVDATTLKAWLDEGDTVLIDVREPAEHEAEHIPGSTLMPLSTFDPAAVPNDPGTRVVLHCQTGARSAQAAIKLLQAGHGAIWCFEGGITAWRAAGYAVGGTGRKVLSVLRQTQLAIGAGVLLGTVLGVTVSPWFLILPGFMGCGLILAGSTGLCPLASFIARLPHNQRGCGGNCAKA